jgi:2-iminobutanoate/2-iminopropanoate deaminase
MPPSTAGLRCGLARRTGMLAAMRLVQLFGPDPGRLQPLGIRFGDTVYASNLTGGSNGMAEALTTLRAVLDEAGVSLDGVARATAYVRTAAERDPVYGPWDALFPDAADRPAFKVLLAPLPPGVGVRLDVLARAGARRQRIDIPGVPARDPTVKIGDWVLTSRVHGTDPRTGDVAAGGIDVEARQAFANIAVLADNAPLAQLTGFVRDADGAAALSRAANDASTGLTTLTNFVPPTMQVMLEAIAGSPSIREVFAHSSNGPIPDAICIDHLLFAPAIGPRTDGDFATQLRAALEGMRATLQQAGLDLTDIGHVTVYMADIDLKPVLNQVWTEWFPNSADRPPHKYVPVDLPSGQLVQLQVFAVKDGRRQVLEIPGLVHGDPMSMGTRIGDLLFSSRIVGTDTASGSTPSGPAAQAPIAFDNLRTLLAQAGATASDLSQVIAFIITADDRAATQAAFDTFASATDGTRPRLHFLTANLPGSTTVRLEAIASLPRQRA